MNREIKFRAWAKNKEMWLWDEIDHKLFIVKNGHIVKCSIEDFISEDYILMQFTGLKDKNEKEIYEGDVVRFNFEGEEKQSQVYVDEDAWSFKGKYYYGDIMVSWEDVEVVGNIYENPELLTNK